MSLIVTVCLSLRCLLWLRVELRQGVELGMLNSYTSLYIIASGLEEELVDQEVQRLQPVPGNLTELLANSLVYPERIQRGKSGLQFLKRSLSVCQQIFSFYTVQILTFADDSSLTLKATNFFLYDQFLPRYKPTVLECCNILNKDSHRRSRRNLFSVVGLSSVCVFSP